MTCPSYHQAGTRWPDRRQYPTIRNAEKAIPHSTPARKPRIPTLASNQSDSGCCGWSRSCLHCASSMTCVTPCSMRAKPSWRISYLNAGVSGTPQLLRATGHKIHAKAFRCESPLFAEKSSPCWLHFNVTHLPQGIVALTYSLLQILSALCAKCFSLLCPPDDYPTWEHDG